MRKKIYIAPVVRVRDFNKENIVTEDTVAVSRPEPEENETPPIPLW